jgi:hypothetical protein
MLGNYNQKLKEFWSIIINKDKSKKEKFKLKELRNSYISLRKIKDFYYRIKKVIL